MWTQNLIPGEVSMRVTAQPRAQRAKAPTAEDASPAIAKKQPVAAVSCQGVTKEFGVNGTKTLALRGVDVDVYDGQLTLLVGPSGCGKTTLISIVAGLLNPTQGSVTVLGTDLAKLSGRRLVESRGRDIGFAFQQYT